MVGVRRRASGFEAFPPLPGKVFVEEAIGAEYGEGFETFRMDGPLKVDVDYLNEKLQECFLQRIRHAMKPDEACGLIFSWDNVIVSFFFFVLVLVCNSAMSTSLLVIFISSKWHIRPSRLQLLVVKIIQTNSTLRVNNLKFVSVSTSLRDALFFWFELHWLIGREEQESASLSPFFSVVYRAVTMGKHF
jgi:hypothetical protein